MILEGREEENSEDDSDDGLESVAGCTCRSQCSRKLKTSANGKVTGCPCKGNGLRCGMSCICGTKNKLCKNKTQEHPTRQPADDGREIEPEDKRSVVEILESLPYETLLAVAKQGFMSRQLQLQGIISSVQNESAGHASHVRTTPIPSFCVCGNCRSMPTNKEMVCCKEKKKCRSKSDAFQNICIESDNLATAIRSLADTYVLTPTYDNRSMRHAAYRQYIMWQHGHLGKGHRRVIPSCCVWEIRKHYPSPNGQYTGYKDA